MKEQSIPPYDSDSVAGFAAMIGLMTNIGNMMDEERQWRKRRSELVYDQPMIGQIPITGGAGSITDPMPGQLAPPRATVWSVRRLNIVGFTAGTVTACIAGSIEPVATFAYPYQSAPVATPAMPATGVGQANYFPYPVAVTITGGTVTAIEVNGNATGLTAGTVWVPAGGYIAITYSAAPAWSWANAIALEPLEPQYFPKGGILVQPGDGISLVATGITLASGYQNVQAFGRADAFPYWYLREYLDLWMTRTWPGG